MPVNEKSFIEIINSAQSKRSIGDLNEAEMNVFNLFTLLLDIQSRVAGAGSVEHIVDAEYTSITDAFPPEQQPLVDDSLEGIGRREVIDG